MRESEECTEGKLTGLMFDLMYKKGFMLPIYEKTAYGLIYLIVEQGKFCQEKKEGRNKSQISSLG